MRVPSLGQEDPLEEGMATHSIVLPGESHGQRSLDGPIPWGQKESNTKQFSTYTQHTLASQHFLSEDH